jgi:two-component system, OmpR family, alkaline phosphatase synthesis response regulator PhoP
MPKEGSPRRALVVEDDPSIRELIRFHLDLAGFTVEGVDDGLRALERARSAAFDLILLDVMLPSLDGIGVCRAVRAGNLNVDTPILMVTARDGESDTVLGLESGADDYLTKPFGVRELMARVTAITRRHERSTPSQVTAAPAVLATGGLTLDRDRRQLTVRGTEVELTKQEFELLYLLASRRGIVFSRAALLRQVWHEDTYVTERTVDAVISRLRRKIEHDPHDPELLLTAWGVGYKFADVAD